MMKNEEKTKILLKKERKKTGEKTRKKKRKRGPKGVPTYSSKLAQKLFYMRTVKRNRNEIETQKKSDFEHQTKKNKMKENERKKKMKEHERT